MYDSATLVLAILGFAVLWTTSIIAGMVWLNGKFRDVEKNFYREMSKHRDEDDRQFESVGLKIQRLELKSFGFTPIDVAKP